MISHAMTHWSLTQKEKSDTDLVFLKFLIFCLQIFALILIF